MGSRLWGVPGAEGPGEAARCSAMEVLGTRSGGAGLLEEMRLRAGRSIRLIL